MFRLNFKKKYDVVILSILLLVAYTYIVIFSSKIVNSDFYAHINHVVNINKGVKNYPSNFIFYLIINLFTFFSVNKFYLYFALVLILSISTVFKYIISKNIIRNLLEFNNSKQNTIIIITVIIFCFYAIPDPYLFLVKKRMYVGKFVPTIWHNSTTILVFPFTLLLFWYQYLILLGERFTNFKTILILCVLIFFNVYIISYTIYSCIII